MYQGSFDDTAHMENSWFAKAAKRSPCGEQRKGQGIATPQRRAGTQKMESLAP
jgi:hypothetical protein